MIENVDSESRICFHPPDAMAKLQKWLGHQHSYHPQKGSDLGEKMKNAFVNAFGEGFLKVVIIGSDIPDLPAEFLRQAFDKLESFDSVIGPTCDGGYYLIGFSRKSFLPEAFDDMVWSTSDVCDQTLAKLKSNNLKVHLLPQWHDVDTRGDMEKLVIRSKNTSFRYSKTYRLIRHSTSKMSET
jgi:rSAM/selenodomain-associated transferase 1